MTGKIRFSQLATLQKDLQKSLFEVLERASGRVPCRRGLGSDTAGRFSAMRGPRSGARIAALAGLIVACCVAAIVFTVDQVSQERQATLLQRGRRGSGKGRSSIAALDGSVFDSPQDIYKQALRRFDRSIKADTSGDALAWAHPRWKSAVTGIVGGVQHASDLEAKIAKDVSRQLSGDISAVPQHHISRPSFPGLSSPRLKMCGLSGASQECSTEAPRGSRWSHGRCGRR